MRYTKEYLETIVAESKCRWDVVEKLKIEKTQGNFTYVSKKIKNLGIDISHFENQHSKSRKKSSLGANSYLKKDKFLTINGNNFKSKLFKEGLKENKCEICGQSDIWRGTKISLILDHIDGDRKNNLIEDVRIVCPNCNSSLPTHCGKNKK
jgi:hypothetical protein